MADNSYAQLIDDFDNGIQVLEGETLTEYIKRMGGVDYESKADGGAIGIEVLFNKRKDFASGGWHPGVGRDKKGYQTTSPHPAAAVKTDFLKKQGWYNSPFKLSGTPLFKAGAEAGGYGLDYDKLTEGGLTLGQVLEGMAGGKYDTFDQGVRDSLESQILGNVDFGKTFQKDIIGPINPVIDPTIEGGKIDIDTKKGDLVEEESEKYLNWVKDGGRVSLQNGGTGNWWDNLEGEALSIYNSMSAYDASDAEIQAKLQEQNLWSPDGTTPNTGQVTGIINQNIGGEIICKVF